MLALAAAVAVLHAHRVLLVAMDVPFISSGALSRAHYSLVRKVEEATSPSEADQYLLAEVEHVRDRLTRSASTVVSELHIYGLFRVLIYVMNIRDRSRNASSSCYTAQ